MFPVSPGIPTAYSCSGQACSVNETAQQDPSLIPVTIRSLPSTQDYRMPWILRPWTNRSVSHLSLQPTRQAGLRRRVPRSDMPLQSPVPTLYGQLAPHQHVKYQSQLGPKSEHSPVVLADTLPSLGISLTCQAVLISGGIGARVDNSCRLLSELRLYHWYCCGKPRQELQNQSVQRSAASRGHSSPSSHLHVHDCSVRSCPVTDPSFSVPLLVWIALHNLRWLHAALGQGFYYQPRLAFCVQDRVLYAAFPLWAQSPMLILPYMSEKPEPRRDSALVPSSATSLEHPSAPDNVHTPLTAAVGSGLGHQQVGTPKIKRTAVLMMIMLAQVRPAIGVIDVNPFLQEAPVLPPAEARPAAPIFSNLRKRSEKRASAELPTTQSSAPCTEADHARSDNCKALTKGTDLPKPLSQVTLMRRPDRLLIWSWNAGGLTSELWQELLLTLESMPQVLRPQIVLIQESHWTEAIAPNFKTDSWTVITSPAVDCKAAALVILLDKQVCSCGTLTYADPLPGRVQHARIETSKWTVDLFNVYQKPHSNQKDHSQPSKELRRHVWQVLRKQLGRIPARHTLIIGRDHNCGLTPSACAGPNPMPDQHLLQKLLEDHQLIQTNSWTRKAGPTYLHHAGHSMIDHLIIRQSQADNLARQAHPIPTKLAAWRQGGRHLPIAGTCRLQTFHSLNRPTTVRKDWDHWTLVQKCQDWWDPQIAQLRHLVRSNLQQVKNVDDLDCMLVTQAKAAFPALQACCLANSCHARWSEGYVASLQRMAETLWREPQISSTSLAQFPTLPEQTKSL